MEKYKLEKVRTLQLILDSLTQKINKLTSGNIAHQIPSLRSITINLNTVMIDELINTCENEDAELKQLLEKIQRNIRAIDNLLQQLTTNTVNNAKKQLITWIQFYTNALDKILMKYEM